MTSHKLKPNKKSFFTYPFYVSLFLLFLVFFVISILLAIPLFIEGMDSPIRLYLILAIFGVWILYLIIIICKYFSLKKRFEKTYWTFTPTSVLWHTGGIFSDGEIEVPIKNITHLSLTKPWLEFKWFKTGRIQIDSAGTSSSSVLISHIEKPDEWYDYVQKLMIHNGFSLQKKKLTQSTKPNVFAVFAKVIGVLAFFLLFVGIQVVIGLIALIIALPLVGIPVFLGVIALVVIPLCLTIYFQYKNLKATEYRVYDDCIEYNNGFLTTHDVIIPAENITDTHLDQQLIDRIFDIRNLKISCQGGSKEIQFHNILHGAAMKEAIDTLNDNFDPIRNEKTHFGDGMSVSAKKSPTVERKVVRDTTATLSFSIVKKSMVAQTLIPLGGFVIVALLALLVAFIFVPGFMSGEGFAILLFSAISGIFPFLLIVGFSFLSPLIRAYTTSYTLGKTTISAKADFISKSQQEFSTDRITSVVVKEGIVQRWFNTCTMYVFSIGSMYPIVFEHVEKDIVESVFKKVGIQQKSSIKRDERPVWSFGMFIVKLIPLLIAIIVIVGIIAGYVYFKNAQALSTDIFIYGALGLLAVLGLVSLVNLVSSFIYVANTSLAITAEHIVLKTGWLTKIQRYTLAQNVRDVGSVKIPFSKRGTLAIEVAGENIPDPNQRNQRKQLKSISNNLFLAYVSDVSDLHAYIDVFLSNTKIQPTVLKTTKPQISPAVIGRTIFSVIVFPLLIIYPFSITHLILSRKAVSFEYDTIKLTQRGGILFKSKKTILLNKIDHVVKRQGPIQKMTGTGTVMIATTGTSSFDMAFFDIKEQEEWYTELKRLSED